MRRAGIYFFFDKDGIVDRYVPYFIQELHKVVDYIVVVVNGKLTAEGRKVLAGCADDLFVRENSGFDAWAHKEAIEYIGWDQLRKFDELVLTNSTVFGPIFPFQQVFDEMEANECDFWGMCTLYEDRTTKTWMGIPLKWGYKPEYIASNFLVFKSAVLHSFEFKKFWTGLPKIRNYLEDSICCEMSISKDLTDAGFVFSAVDKGAFRHVCPSATVYGAHDLVVQYQVPIIRKKAFYDPNAPLDYCTDNPRKLMEFIRDQTQYDCDLIWESLLRTVNQYDLKNWFNWNIILPANYSLGQGKDFRIAVIFHTYYTDIMEQYFHNIESFPDGTDFYFTTDTQEKLDVLQELLSPLGSRFSIEYRMVENRGRDVSALLVGCRDVVLSGGYDLICFMHDKKGIGNSSSFSCVGRSYSDCCFENVAASADYVNNVISLFQEQPRLGIAVPPPPKNAGYYKVIGGSWTNNYQNTVRLLRELEQCVPLDEKKPPVAPYGSVFWFRPKALLPLFERAWEYENFDAEPMASDGTISNAIERAHSLIAQGSGYYPSIIMNADYAGQEITRMTEIAHTYVELTMQYVGPKILFHQATTQFVQMLQGNKKTALTSKDSTIIKLKAATPNVRGPARSFIRGICPIGLWNLLRRMKCAMFGGVYVEPKVPRSPFKAFVRACMPRALWDQLRKAKCRENGWIFVPEE